MHMRILSWELGVFRQGSSSSFPSKERAVLGVVDLFALPCLAFLPHYLVVETCNESSGNIIEVE